MIGRPPSDTRTDTLVPDTTLFRSVSTTSAAMRQRLYSARFKRELQGYSALTVFRSHANHAPTDDPLLLALPVARFGLVETLDRSEEHTSELQSLMRNSYADFCYKKNTNTLLPAKTKIYSKY